MKLYNLCLALSPGPIPSFSMQVVCSIHIEKLECMGLRTIKASLHQSSISIATECIHVIITSSCYELFVCLSQLEKEFKAERIQQTKAHEIMTKYVVHHPWLCLCYGNHHFFRELKAQHEREMDFLHNSHSDQVHSSATKFMAHNTDSVLKILNFNCMHTHIDAKSQAES